MSAEQILPFTVLRRVFEFLPLTDILTVTKVCKEWKIIAIGLLRKVKINESTPFGGSWCHYNNQFIKRHKDGTDWRMKKFVHDLCKCTDGIEHLSIEVDTIIPCIVEELLLSQKAIKTLVIRVSDKPTVPVDISTGIFKHESTLKKLDLRIQNYDINFQELASNLENMDSCFANLKKVKYFVKYGGYQALDEVEKKNVSTVFKRIFGNAKIEELGFRPKRARLWSFLMPLNGYFEPIYNGVLRESFRLGAFYYLKKINISVLMTLKDDQTYLNVYAEFLINHCPMITHIDSGDNDFRRFIGRRELKEAPWIQLAMHYGRQLIWFDSFLMSNNIARCIHETCPNLKAITICDVESAPLSRDALLLLADLPKLRSVNMEIEHSSLEPHTILDFLEEGLWKLESFTINYNSFQVSSILYLIGRYGQRLKRLYMRFSLRSFRKNGSLNEKHVISTMDGVLSILDRCRNLRELTLAISTSSEHQFAETVDKYQYAHSVTESLISNQQNLKFFSFGYQAKFEVQYQKRLANNMPHCKFEF